MHRLLVSGLVLMTAACGSSSNAPPVGDGAAVEVADGEDDADGRGEAGGDTSDGAETGEVAEVIASEDYASFAETFSRLYCRRVFSCCTVDDRLNITGMDDEATCFASEHEVVVTVGVDLIKQGLSAYDRDAATACLRDLTARPCGEVFTRDVGRLAVCANVLKGLSAAGVICEGDVECASGLCTAQGCASAPLVRCPGATEFFDEETAKCLARREAGGACLAASTCVSTLTCVANACAPALADGEACEYPRECAGTCRRPGGTDKGVCGRAACLGP